MVVVHNLWRDSSINTNTKNYYSYLSPTKYHGMSLKIGKVGGDSLNPNEVTAAHNMSVLHFL